jgi:hypothetical protein
MHRREFLAASGFAALTAASKRARATARNLSSTARPVRVTVDARRRFETIPADFIGLGYEVSSVAIPDLLSAQNRTYVELVRTLSPAGVIRIGGNTSDDHSFNPTGEAVSAPKGTVINVAALRNLGSFLDATNWRLIWGLNLGSADERQVLAEAEAVAATAKDKLLAFEIGNEPDLFGHRAAHRPLGYSYGSFLKEYRQYKAAIRARLPGASFAGPDVASATDWVGRFAADEGTDLVLLTHHYYRECANPNSTLDKLLHPDPKLAPELRALRNTSISSKKPYRICETNSFCGGGKPGVSDTFGAALWVLDFMFTLAAGGCAGVNIETGVNQLGFISSYSPISQREQGGCFAAPEYFGMLAFAQGSRGERLAVDCDAASVNFTAYAVAGRDRNISVTLINKDASVDAEASISIPEYLAKGSVYRLSASSLESKEGVTFAGAGVTARGEWKPRVVEQLGTSGGHCQIRVPAGSAAVIQWTVSAA